jgi:hypothetical protein
MCYVQSNMHNSDRDQPLGSDDGLYLPQKVVVDNRPSTKGTDSAMAEGESYGGNHDGIDTRQHTTTSAHATTSSKITIESLLNAKESEEISAGIKSRNS